MNERVPCIVPGCRCTRSPGTYVEWICTKHWKLVPRDMKRVYSRAKQRFRRQRKGIDAVWRIWERCKTEAIRENFMGFAG